MVRVARVTNAYRVFTVCNTVLLIVLSFAFLFPFVFVIARSLSDGFYVLSGQVFLYPRGFTLQAYEVMLSDPRMLKAMWFTTQLAVLGTVLNLLFTILAAYPLSRSRLAGVGFILGLVFVSWYFNPGLIPTYLVVRGMGLIDTIWALIFPDVIQPFLLIILITYIRGIPHEMEEAAVVEGSSYWGILRRIVIPICRPVIATLIIFYAVGHWNQFFQGLLYINDSDKYTLQMRLRIIIDLFSERLQNVAVTTENDGSMVAETAQAAAIIIATVPIVLIYPFLQRHFIKGVTLGAIKG